MKCVKPIMLSQATPTSEPLVVPCGKCLLCRIQKRKEWSMRMLHELDQWKEKAMFLTLTYDDKYLPASMAVAESAHQRVGDDEELLSLVKDYQHYELVSTLRKSDLQNFFKRLRTNTGKKIKYFASGEYGPTTGRPHYHAIIFGLGLRDKLDVIQAWKYCDWNQHSILKNSFGIAEPESIEYVAGYIHSKLSGDLAEEEYDMKGREPVFSLKSNGLGLAYVLSNKEQLIANEEITVRGTPYTFPRYYINKLGLDNSDFRKNRIREKELKEYKELGAVNSPLYDFLYGDLKKCNDFKELQNKKNIQTEKNVLGKLNLKTKKL